MTIKKIKVKNQGLHGLEVVYMKPILKDGRTTMCELTEKRKHPVHIGLETLIKSLRINLLEVNRVLAANSDEDEAKWLLSECEITEIAFDEDYFQLTGTLLAFEEKFITVKTPKVDSGDNYDKFRAVMDTINEIVTEVKEYLAGTKKVDETELVVRWMQAGKSEAELSAFEKMSDEEKREFCKEFLQNKYGDVVMTNEDFEVVDSEIEEVVDLPNQFLIEGNTIEINVTKEKASA